MYRRHTYLIHYSSGHFLHCQHNIYMQYSIVYHLHAFRRVLRYLKKSLSQVLQY
ncbi:hypothetical protein M6B38_211260 [Iris pallida]|uniref:Uncharacterized protein n=1 Tax=Iris pallida TaxID=29817 RepID=A0AAX6E4F9_IRIPA|nr:hypothetical protein M6B38_211260 [Iris pallida]